MSYAFTIRPRPVTRSKHRDTIAFFNQLLIDLKKRELGHEHTIITMDRLNEATMMLRDLELCKEQIHFVR